MLRAPAGRRGVADAPVRSSPIVERPSPRRSRTLTRGTCCDRGQGARAGTGAGGRAQGALRHVEVARSALRALNGSVERATGERRVPRVRGWTLARRRAGGRPSGERGSAGASEPGAAHDDRLSPGGAGDLFVGLRGERSDGGEFAVQALTAGPGVAGHAEHAQMLSRPAGGERARAPDPFAGLAALARAWRRELGARA